MIFIPFFEPPELTVRNPIQDAVVFVHTMENSFSSSRRTRVPASRRRSWRGRFQRALARVSKFFRRGRRSTRG
ncbi:protein FAM236D-like [Arvicanthis niloticus]|uniref:protein FAM236D-like n=1 Tax=Arvicanthis niloticus TaxID=61156 RepID=UPI00402B609E